ncbi:nuclear transport factor 2 family protein [Streptomyces sp. NBC_01390]|uniref:nuclear transport factor 2 family protein n=1 Tax=Streptomyces sp. NBC_01390 TaxID=2903850 RepID=UPI003247DF0F
MPGPTGPAGTAPARPHPRGRPGPAEPNGVRLAARRRRRADPEFPAGDSASGETDSLAHEMYAAADAHARMRVRGIRYRDSYRRTTGTWRFFRRELTVDRAEDRVLTAPTGH